MVVDIHAHPSLKIYMFNKKFHERHRTGGAFNPFGMRVDLPKIIEGGVNVLFSSVYVPEKGILDDCWLLKLFSYIAPRKWKNMVKGNPFEQVKLMSDRFQQAVASARGSGLKQPEFAASVSEVKRIVKQDGIAIVQALEGTHALNGKIENLRYFFEQGVALITLIHFYPNEVAYPVDAIPKNMKILWCFRKKKDLTRGLTEFGRQVVEEMLNLGILIDLSHLTPLGREQVYEINRDHPSRRPLVASHVGVKKFCDVPYNLSDPEIKAIADSGGVIGVIFMNHWLSDTAKKYGMNYIVDTVKHLRDVGGVECIAIGSDFDGFTDPPDDLKDISQMPALSETLLQAGFSTGEVEKILGGNVMRVLENGWGKK
jgi:membrane dipeptidase